LLLLLLPHRAGVCLRKPKKFEKFPEPTPNENRVGF